MDPRVRDILTHSLGIEGGFVSAERARRVGDPGGATNHGISLRYAASKGLLFDLDQDGDVDEADIRLITPEQALDAFYRDFYLAPKLDRLPAELQPVMVDYQINSGAQAVKSLQSVVGNYGFATTVDGGIGPKTIAAVEQCLARVGAAVLINALCDERLRFLRDLVRRQPWRQPNLAGWTSRALSFKV